MHRGLHILHLLSMYAAHMLGTHSKRVEVRFFAAAGSLHFIFYDGGVSSVFQDGFNQIPPAHVANMVQLARSLPPDTSSLFIRWLQEQPNAHVPPAVDESESTSQDDDDGDSQVSDPEVTPGSNRLRFLAHRNTENQAMVQAAEDRRRIAGNAPMSLPLPRQLLDLENMPTPRSDSSAERWNIENI
jgi:hypothetical protein